MRLEKKRTQPIIPCPGLIACSRDDETYPDGYLIERQVQGTAADKIQLDREQETRLYVKLAEQLSSVHGIGIKNYGYIGCGVACYDSLIDFFEDEFDRFDTALKDAVSEIQLKKLKEKVLHTIHKFEDLPSVLCHGDLSKKNIILRDNGEISLIDWDDAMTLNWYLCSTGLFAFFQKGWKHGNGKLFQKLS